MIIVEGPDGAGKSTLVKELCDHYGFEVGVRGVKDRDLLWTVTVPDTFRALGDAVQGHEAPRVWDRLYYSDFVYAPIQGRFPAFKPVQSGFIEMVINQTLKAPVIWCMPPRREVMRHALNVHQMEGVNENLNIIYDSYVNLMGDCAPYPNHFTYNYMENALSDVFTHTDRYLNRRSDRDLLPVRYSEAS